MLAKILIGAKYVITTLLFLSPQPIWGQYHAEMCDMVTVIGPIIGVRSCFCLPNLS
jgi:hypothetical protein